MEEMKKDDTQKPKTPAVTTNNRVVFYLSKEE